MLGQHADGVRAGADQGHLAPDHVPELRQLVEAGAAQEPADLGDPVVIGGDLAARRRSRSSRCASSGTSRPGPPRSCSRGGAA